MMGTKRRRTRQAKRRPHLPTSTKAWRWRDGERQTRVVVRDPDGPARWAFYKRIPPRSLVRPEPHPRGHGEGPAKGRRTTAPLTLVCRRAGCGALICWRMAKAAARKGGRQAMAAGAGCANPRHDARRGEARKAARGHRHQKRFEETQLRMARELEEGERILVAWPEAENDMDVWERPEKAKQEAIRQVRHGRGDARENGGTHTHTRTPTAPP